MSYDLISADISELRELLRYDHESFIRFILADELEDEGVSDVDGVIPDFHIAGFRLMVGDEEENKRVAIAWPRDHAKTTLAKVAVVYRLVYGLSKFPIYLSNTSKVAAAASRDIMDFLEMERVQAVFGTLVLDIDTRAQGTFAGKLVARDGNIITRFNLMSLGAGQQIRGTNRSNKRPDYMVVDDLESAEEGEANKLGYEQLKKWFYGTVRKALKGGNHKIVQIGNYVSNLSILGDHIASPYWRSIRLSAFRPDGTPLWAKRWTLQGLIDDFMEYLHEKQAHVWLAEMLNLPFSESSAGIKPDRLELVDPISAGDPRIILRCITVDPAISENVRRADSSVICVHVLVRDNTYSQPYWQLAEIDSRKGRGPYKLYADIVGLALKWNVRAIGIEGDAYQAALIHIAEHEASKAGYWFLKFIKLTTMKKSKASRIIAWSEFLNTGEYRLTRRHFGVISQLLQYDIHSEINTDDEIDCCSYILHMIKSHLGEMSEAVVSREPYGERRLVRQSFEKYSRLTG